jgi:hypothetical protein
MALDDEDSAGVIDGLPLLPKSRKTRKKPPEKFSHRVHNGKH